MTLTKYRTTPYSIQPHPHGEYYRVADVDPLLDEILALRTREARLVEAWRQSWDCSHDPGHTIMNTAIAALKDKETTP